MRRSMLLLAITALAGLVLASLPAPAAAATVGPPEISWAMADPLTVRFHLRFHNPDPLEPTLQVSGQMYSQEFGAFLPHYGQIGTFNVPPMVPNSFFDVFFDVPLSSLPPSPGATGATGGNVVQAGPCPPLIWVGNVDVTWAGPGGAGQVNKHFGVVGVCPGEVAACLHVLTGCANNLTWAINLACPGWHVQLRNEDNTPAPAILPPGWTGWLCVWADASVPVGSQCCFSLDLFCNGVKATIDVCADACACGTPTLQDTWGHLKMLYR